MRIAVLANKEETNEVLKDSRLSNGTFKNNGHTAVSRDGEMSDRTMSFLASNWTW